MVTVTTRGRKVEIPSKAEELNPEQYERFCEIASALLSKRLTLQRARELWLSYLIGLRGFGYNLLKQEFKSELDAQLSAIDGFFPDGSPDFSTPKNLLPAYRDYKGPGDWLEGVTFGQLTECLTLMNDLNEENTDRIARILYRMDDSDEVPALLFFHAPRLLAAVWNAITAAPVCINGAEVDFSIIFQPIGESRPDDHTGWTGVLFEVAAAGVFGNIKEVEETDFWTVLLYLYKCKFDYKHMLNSSK